MLFLGWLLAAFVVVGAINIYLKFVGHPKLRTSNGSPGGLFSRGTRIGGGMFSTVAEGETCGWVNSLLAWMYLHYNHTPEFVEGWLKSLNDQARKHANEVTVKFDRVQSGSLPPKFSNIKTEVSPNAANPTFTIYAALETTDFSFLVSILQQSAQNMKVANADVVIKKLIGQLQVQLKMVSVFSSEQIDVTASFTQPPDLSLQIRPKSEVHFEASLLERVVRDAIAEAAIMLSLSPWGSLATFATSAPRSQAIFSDNIQAQTSIPVSSGRPFSLKDRRLLVKVIKANGLGDKLNYGTGNPYCTVHLDDPPQKHSTSIVRSSTNPFWDEHFMLDLADTSNQLQLEVLDREKNPGDDFLGRAVIPMNELRRMPSSRQIIPLQGRSGNPTVTVEFLFMEGNEGMQSKDGLSPRRRIETTRGVLPGGISYTSATTTTERPRDVRLDTGFNDIPNRVEKVEGHGGHGYGTLDYSPYSSRSSQYGPQDTTSQASQALGSQLDSPRFMFTPALDGDLRGKTPSELALEQGREGRSQTLGGATDAKETGLDDDTKKTKTGFASALKKRFQRPRKAQRSQSADRAGPLRHDQLLRPPDSSSVKTTDDLEQTHVPEEGLKRSRSHSFSSSLRKLFKGKKKNKAGAGTNEGQLVPSSRDSSVSRSSVARSQGYDSHQYQQPSPQLSSHRYDNIASSSYQQQPSPEPSPRLLSTSVPATAPIYDR